ncbi:MAG: hypothetical protein DRR08_17550 [Candidatus Parabeggiatoa sp. nov. 2]|nr:MAG: hypothetical protein DRR08_17550 [Gammaproteobacteria bacterium]
MYRLTVCSRQFFKYSLWHCQTKVWTPCQTKVWTPCQTKVWTPAFSSAKTTLKPSTPTITQTPLPVQVHHCR